MMINNLLRLYSSIHYLFPNIPFRFQCIFLALIAAIISMCMVRSGTLEGASGFCNSYFCRTTRRSQTSSFHPLKKGTKVIILIIHIKTTFINSNFANHLAVGLTITASFYVDKHSCDPPIFTIIGFYLP